MSSEQKSPLSRVVGIIVTAVPSVVFVAVNAACTLWPALGAAAASAVVIFLYRLIRKQPLKQALIGLAIATACAGVAAFTGDARDFFIAPALIPVAAMLVCIGSLIVRRPLTGVLLNRVVGGPGNWYELRPLLRVYALTTATAVAINIVNFGLQAVFYVADNTIVLAAIHVATGPVFATLVAVTLVFARKEVKRHAQRHETALLAPSNAHREAGR
ncbi:DUF3159 domain-containing protein [Paracoccus nototheniae]|uniref:DUF3159 domain-containing protein n=1 Tax=Paracoccus nototheniae TaxID=2489002 RepID=A0ABW4DU94_9RHOB|nr:DUF3159 domain-containing protein [Paracoccus nototheniae]